MKKRNFLKTSLAAATTAFFPKTIMAMGKTKDRLRTAHIGVGGMGLNDLNSIASHPKVKIVALCDVDSNAIIKASSIYPDAKTFKDYRVMLKSLANEVDAVVVSTPEGGRKP